MDVKAKTGKAIGSVELLEATTRAETKGSLQAVEVPGEPRPGVGATSVGVSFEGAASLSGSERADTVSVTGAAELADGRSGREEVET